MPPLRRTEESSNLPEADLPEAGNQETALPETAPGVRVEGTAPSPSPAHTRSRSLAAKLLLVSAPSWIVAPATAILAQKLGFSFGPSWVAGVGSGFLLAAIFIPIALRRPAQMLQALDDGLASLRSHDYSLRLATGRDDELGRMAEIYNELSEILAQERSDLRRREILLRTVIESSPAGVLLINAADRMILDNQVSRALFNHGRTLTGQAWVSVLEGCPAALRDALETGQGALVSIELDGEEEVFHVTRRTFDLDTRRHLLILVRRMSSELRRQEVAIWKKVIRVIAHELDNSLAPIRSMVHSARLIRTGQAENHQSSEANDARLDEILGHIEESAVGIHRFVDGYRKFARLPEPRLKTIPLPTLLGPLAEVQAFRLECEVDPASVVLKVDPAQIRQAFLNLLENARDAGSDDSRQIIRVLPRRDGFALVQVLDRGSGMDDETFAKALLPFFSSKKDGTGLGLALVREIVEAHGGRISLAQREAGGLAVSCLLPLATDEESAG